MVTKNQLKILRYIYRKQCISYSKFVKKSNGIKVPYSLIHITDHRKSNENGFPIGDIMPSEDVTLTDEGIVVVEQKQWFNLHYVVTQIALPIAIAIITTLLTITLTT